MSIDMDAINEKILELETCAESLVRAIKSSRNRLLDDEEAAVYLGAKPSTLRIMRCKGRGAKYIKSDGLGIKYDIKDLDAYIDSLPRKGGGLC